MFNIKISLSILIVLCFQFFCWAQNPISNQSTIIQGYVYNFSNVDDLPIIELKKFYPFLIEVESWSDFIKDDGSFKFEIRQEFSEDLLLFFREPFYVYSNPGDSIFLSIDAKMLYDSVKINNLTETYIQVSSPNQEFQDRFQEFRNAFREKFETQQEFERLTNAQKALSYDDYSTFLSRRTESYNFLLDSIIADQILNSNFEKWAKDWIQLTEYVDLLRYAWLHPKYNNLDRSTFNLPEEYYSFLDDPWCNNVDIIRSQMSKRFMHEAYMHWNQKFRKGKMGAKAKALFSQDIQSVEGYKCQINDLEGSKSGFQRSFLVSKFLSQLLQWKYLDVFDSLMKDVDIGNRRYKRILNSRFQNLNEEIESAIHASDVFHNIHELPDSTMIFNRLPSLYPGKVIYLDFWAPWCGPCLNEIDNYHNIKEAILEMDVVKVYLGVKCSKKSWKSTIASKNISGEHFLLSDNEYKLLSSKFNIGGIPRYMIIDKSGKIVNDNAPSPSQTNLIELLKEYSEE